MSSIQDSTERILRGLHVMLSRSESYAKDPTKVIVDKEGMLELLAALNKCMYEMMEAYEQTQESRDSAEREFRKHTDEIVENANSKAEDVYAASVMYTDEALNKIQDLMQETQDAVQGLFENLIERMKEEKHNVRSNQIDLKSQLGDLTDTDKYLQIIEERNRELAREKELAEKQLYINQENLYANRQSAVRVDPDVLKQLGISFGDEEQEEPAQEQMGTKAAYEDASAEPTGNEAETSKNRRTEAAPHVSGKKKPAAAKPKKYKTAPERSFALKDIDVMDLAEEDDDVVQQKPIRPQARAEKPQVRVDNNASYFKWKAKQEKLAEREAAAQERQEHRAEQTEEEAAREELSAGIHEIWEDLTSE